MTNLKRTFLGKKSVKEKSVQDLQFVLASASSRRFMLLAQIGLEPHEVCATDIDETPKSREHPASLAKRLAKEKALKAQEILLWRNQNEQQNMAQKWSSWLLIPWWRWGVPFFLNQRTKMRLMNVCASFRDVLTRFILLFAHSMTRGK